MADIEILRTYKDFHTDAETTIRINYSADVSESMLKKLFEEKSSLEDFSLPSETEKTVYSSKPNMKRSIYTSITPDELKKAVSEGRGPDVIRPFDEIDIPTDNGGTVTVVCAFVNEKMARFVFKDCWDKCRMNDAETNKTGYRDSIGRKHVLNDIYPHILKEWRDIITPRKLTETINGETVEYSDPMWLPSATDLFESHDGKQLNNESDSFQLPVFKHERNRVKEYDDEGTYPWWLRSAHDYYDTNFYAVDGGGAECHYNAVDSIGFAPGFDI